MKTIINETERWWSTVREDERAFLKKIVALVERVEAGQVLWLEHDGRGFRPTLFGAAEGGPGHGGSNRPREDQSAETWWAGLSDGMKRLVLRLSVLARDVMRNRDRRVEVRGVEHGWKVALVLRFRRPVGGKAELN